MELNFKQKFILFAIGAFVVLIWQSVFVVGEREQALVMQFQKAQRVVTEAGLNVKVPFIQNIKYFDNRLLEYTINEQEVLDKQDKRLIIDAFVRYKIKDPLKFFQSTNNEFRMRERLDSILESGLREVVATYTIDDMLSAQRSEIMDEIKDYVNDRVSGRVADEEAQKGGFGIEIIDVRIMRADLPPANSQAVFRRMQTEREKEAKRIRATGAEESNKIKSNADKDAKVILANADKESQILRGEGDAVATKTFARAFNKDRDFFEFYRSMQAYRKSLNKEDTSIILSPNSKFLKFIER